MLSRTDGGMDGGRVDERKGKEQKVGEPRPFAQGPKESVPSLGANQVDSIMIMSSNQGLCDESEESDNTVGFRWNYVQQQ